MTIDRKRIDAVNTLEALGYVYKDGQWIEDDGDWLGDDNDERTVSAATTAYIEQYKANLKHFVDRTVRFTIESEQHAIELGFDDEDMRDLLSGEGVLRGNVLYVWNGDSSPMLPK